MLSNVEISKKDFLKLPFFSSLDKMLNEFYITKANGISYVIWGGVATNLLLQFTNQTNIFFSTHDIEIFFEKDNKVLLDDSLYDNLNSRLMNDYSITIGGISILNKIGVKTVLKFQEDRIALRDGDLFINNIAIRVYNDKIIVNSSKETLDRIFSRNIQIQMKSKQNLCNMHSISRRIYRTVSKVIRFETYTNLRLDNKANNEMKKLIELFTLKLKACFLDGKIVKNNEWLKQNRINDYSQGVDWLYQKTLSETAKRLLKYEGNSLTEFTDLLENQTGVWLNNRLFYSINKLKTSSTLTKNDEIFNIFKTYKIKGAEELFSKYSTKASG